VALRAFAQAHDLRLVVLFGSRARGAETAESDLDLGVWLARTPSAAQRSAIVRGLIELCGTDRLDVAFLDTASPLLVWQAARNGKPLFEASRGVFSDFCVRAFQLIVEVACDVNAHVLVDEGQPPPAFFASFLFNERVWLVGGYSSYAPGLGRLDDVWSGP
jgi:predicted nucleotidyltransferase